MKKVRLVKYDSKTSDVTGPPEPDERMEGLEADAIRSSEKNPRMFSEEEAIVRNREIQSEAGYLDPKLSASDNDAGQSRSPHGIAETIRDVFMSTPNRGHSASRITESESRPSMQQRIPAQADIEPCIRTETDRSTDWAAESASFDSTSDQWFSSGSIGGILLDAGKIRPEHAEQIIQLQQREGLRFGEAAIKLGLATESDIQFALSRQFDYPYLTPDSHHLSQELVAAYQPFSHQVEALRAIRTQLMLRWFDVGATNSLAIVSTTPGDGRSYLAANLAIVFSQLGEKTLLIDADLRRPRQHELFNLSNQGGFSTYLSGRADIPTIHRIEAFIDLSVMTAGPIPPNPQELLYRPTFTQLLQAMNREYNVVIIDTPSATLHADAQQIAAKAGSTVIVTRKNKTKINEVGALTDSIRAVGGTVVGGVVNEY